MNVSILTEESSLIDDVNEDPDFVLHDEILSTDSETDDESYETSTDRCFLVYENQLKSLLLHCTICGAKVDPTLTKESLVNGSQLSLKLHCFSGHTGTWKSQPDLTYVKGIGNLDIVAAVTFPGIPFAKFEKFAWLLKLKGGII